MTTMVLIDNVAVYQQVFGVVTIPMIIFALRFSLENPKGLPLKAFKLSNGKVVELSQVEHLAKLSRKEFLEAAMPLVSAAKKGR